jgi:hypothetical protein
MRCVLSLAATNYWAGDNAHDQEREEKLGDSAKRA